ncbi:MAG: hypothetical protein J0H94_05930 [Rhizobiales bacterium]|nr:hypothetical protein [Hyphomicrobiales bacterium]
MLRAVAFGLGLAAASPAFATDELTEAFAGRWYAQGDCSDKNEVPGAVILVTPSALQGHGFACTFSKVEETTEGEGRRADLHRICASSDTKNEADVRMYLIPSQVVGETLVTVNQDGSFLTLYKRCP